MNSTLGSFVTNLFAVLGDPLGRRPAAAAAGTAYNFVTDTGDHLVTDTGAQTVANQTP